MLKTLIAVLFLTSTTATTLAEPVQGSPTSGAEEYLRFAGDPVDRFQLLELQRWVLLDEQRIVVWPRLNQAFLLRVDPPCQELEWAHKIGLTSSANVVNKRFDSVIVGDDRCRINEIRPIDLKRMKAAKADS